MYCLSVYLIQIQSYRAFSKTAVDHWCLSLILAARPIECLAKKPTLGFTVLFLPIYFSFLLTYLSNLILVKLGGLRAAITIILKYLGQFWPMGWFGRSSFFPLEAQLVKGHWGTLSTS